MNGDESSFGHVYRDPEASRRFGAFLRRATLAVGLLAVLGPLVVALVASDRVGRLDGQASRNTAQDDLAFTAVSALAPRSAWAGVFDSAGLEVIVIGPDGHREVLLTSTSAASSEATAWRSEVQRSAEASSGRSFRTRHVDGSEWQHSKVTWPGGVVLISGRQLETLESPLGPAGVLLLVSSVASVLAICGFGLLLHRRVVRPSQALLDASEDLRVRGEIRPDVVSKLDAISSTPIELSRMGGVLREIEVESQRGFRQIEALLQSASVLGGSLDEQTVLDASLERLQKLLGIDRSAILRYQAHSNTFEVLAMRGHSEEWVQEMASTPGHESQASLLALRDEVPNQIVDTEAAFVVDSVRRRARRHGYRSILAVPFTSELERPTVLVLQSRQPRSYSFDEIGLSKLFASMASAALRNAELFAKTDERLRLQTSRLEAIVESVEHGLLVGGSDGRLLYANAFMKQLGARPLAVSAATTVDRFLDCVLANAGLGQSERAELDALYPCASSWVDLDMSAGVGDAAAGLYRVRKFVVRDARGGEIGRGMTFTDVSRDRELERMKSGLLAAVSHEFRTPLALIKGYATTLLADDVEWNQTDQTEFLRMVSSEADRLTDLVQRILDMRRIDAGMVSLQLMPVSFDVVVESMLEALKQHSDRIEVADFDHLAVEMDSARITTVLRNLVENACKYSDGSLPVELEIHDVGDELHVSVRDYGRGVSPEFRDRIFDTFVRGEPGQQDEHEGIGLGLAISKGFVEAHGGAMWLRDPESGPGSVFGFSLPRVRKLAGIGAEP